MGKLIIEKYFKSDTKHFNIYTHEIKMIANYTGLNMIEIKKLPHALYCLYRRDAWIYQQQQTEEGREFLKDLYTLQQSEADYDKINEVSIKA